MASRFGEDREGSERAQKIEKEQKVAIRARSERRWRRFIAERGRKIKERVSQVCGADETTGAYCQGKELGKVARGYQIRDKRE